MMKPRDDDAPLPERIETTDGRYVRLGPDEWLDTTNLATVPEATVDKHMADNRVGIAVINKQPGTRH